MQTDFGFLGCSSDVLRQTDKLCSGRRHCSIPVPQPLFEATKPCNKEFKLYLEANYSCVRGMRQYATNFENVVKHDNVMLHTSITLGYSYKMTKKYV